MSNYGVFEASSTDGHEEEQRQRQATRDLGRAIEAAREGFGDFLGAATDKDDYKDRLALVMNDLMQKVADSGVMPVPGVMRKVKAALRPEFRQAANEEALEWAENYFQKSGGDKSDDPAQLWKDALGLAAGEFGTNFSAEDYARHSSRKQAYDSSSIPGMYAQWAEDQGLDPHSNETLAEFGKQFSGLTYDMQQEISQEFLSSRKQANDYEAVADRAADDFERDTGNDPYTDPNFITQYLPAWASANAQDIAFDPALYEELENEANMLGYGYTVEGRRKQAGLQWDKQDYNMWSYSSQDSGLDYWIKDRSDGKIGWSVFDYLSGEGDSGTASSFEEAEELIEGFIGSQSPDGAFNQLGSRKQASDVNTEDQGVLQFFYQFEDEGLDVSASGDEQWEWLKSNIDYDVLQDAIDQADEYGEVSRSNIDSMAYDLQQNFFGSRKRAFTQENLGNGYYGIFYSAPSGKTDVDIFDSGDSLLTELTGADSPEMARKQAVEYVDSISSPEFTSSRKQAGGGNWEQSYDGSDEWKLTGNPQVVIMSEDDGFYLFNGVELVEVTDTLEQAMDLGESSHVAGRKADSRRKRGSRADSVEAIVEFLIFCDKEGISEESHNSLDLYNGDDEISQDDYNTIYDFIAGDSDDDIYTSVNNRYRQRTSSRRKQARDEYMEELKEWYPVEYNAFMESLSPGTVYEPGELEILHKKWVQTQGPFDEGDDGMTASRKQALELGEWEEDLPGLGYAKATKTPGGGWEVYIWDEAGQNETLTPANSSEEARRLFYDTIKGYPGSGYDHIDF